MNAAEEYITNVLRNIHAPESERERIETDLRAHFLEATAAGESPRSAIARMGSPAEVAAEFMSSIGLHYANFWSRLGAYLIDLAILYALAAISAIIGAVLFVKVPRNPQTWEWILGGMMIAGSIGFILAALGVILLYFPILEGRFGVTPGKRLFGLAVVRENGLPIGYKEAFLRNLSYYLSEFLPLDALFVPFTAKRQRAFDIVARTVVIQVEKAKYAGWALGILLLISVATLLGLGVALRGSQVRVGWSGSHEPGRMAYSYQEFTGYESSYVPADAGQTIQITYQANVATGKLGIKVLNPKRDVIWLVQLVPSSSGVRDSVPVPAGMMGNYTIVVEGQGTAGAFDVAWEKK